MKQYNTKSKEAIINYIKARKGTRFCAADLMMYLGEQEIEINQATVYRNLEKLTEQGSLLKTKNSADDSCYYQYALPEKHCGEHLHLQCKKCGKVIHLEGEKMDGFYRYVRDELGFCLQHKESVLVGICAECGDRGEK